MQKKFLIIGLTGPIGSGCGDVANFIATGISKYSDFIIKERESLDEQIANHFNFIHLKSIEYKNKIIINEQHHEKDAEDIYSGVNPLDLARDYESKLKSVNRNLRELLIRRKIYRYFLKNEWKQFYSISMSTLLVKLLLTYTNSTAAKTFFEKKKISDSIVNIRGFKFKVQHPVLGYWRLLKKLHRVS